MAIQTSPAPKRRRKPLPDGSSREGSAESNDESGESLEEDNESLLSGHHNSTAIGVDHPALPHIISTTAGIALTSRDSFDAASASQSQNQINSPNSAGQASNGRHPAGKRFTQPSAVAARALAGIETDGEGIMSEGSAGHDGDISSATAPSGNHSRNPVSPSPISTTQVSPQITATQGEPSRSRLPLSAHELHHLATASTSAGSSAPPSPHHSPIASRHPGHGGMGAPPSWAAAPQGFLSNLTPSEIQEHIRTAIAVPDPGRAYKIMAPPVGRPVRIYADGVYDLLHYGHMLQLRQCKLAFPSVHLMVGVCSDELVRKYKASPVLTSAERYESVRHCKWVDEVVEDAPWCVDAEFFAKHRIDYVAHDEEPYAMKGSEDVYGYAKSIGAFLPTKRTNGVSTSELLQRIVEGYREGEYDNKFIKLGLPDLCSARNSTRNGSETSKKSIGQHGGVPSAVNEEPSDVPEVE